MDAESENWKDYRKGPGEILRVYRWIWKKLLNKEARHLLRPITLFTLFGNALAMSVPWIFGRLIDQVRTHELRMTVFLLGGFAAAKFLHKRCGYRVGYARELFFGASRGSVDEATNRLFFEKSLGQMLQDHDQLSAANLNKGRTQLYQIMDLLLFEGIEVALMLVMAFICLWILHPLSGAIVTTVFTIFCLWSRFLHRKLAEVCVPIDVAFRWLERHRTETWDKAEKVKTGGKEEEEVGFMADRFREILTKDRSFWLWFIRQITRRSLLNDLALLAIVMIGSRHVWRGEWSLGLFYPVYTWSCLIIDSFERISRIEQRVSWSLPPVSSLKETLTMEPDIRDQPTPIELDVTTLGVRVEIAHVSHAYHSRSKDGEIHPVLSDVSFTIEPGQVVALLAPSGGGKSTLMRLMQRGMDPEQGAILVNGHDLRALRLRSWLMHTGYIPQQPIILTGTIRSNLLYGLDPEARARVTDEELLELMRDLRIDFGRRLTHGLETPVGERGIKLSGGEAQRLSIGSAVAKRPRFMLIDEATSALDSTTEKEVQIGLARALQGNVSALIIAHRLSTVRHICNKFVVLKRVDDLTEGESQVEAVADSFENLYPISRTFRNLADDQGIIIAH